MPDPELLNVYGQAFPHTEVYVVGNRAGLEVLKRAIDQALFRSGTGKGTGGVFVADGEGFKVIVLRIDAPWDSPTWDKLAVPYEDEAFRETREGADVVWPWRLEERKEGEGGK